MRSHLPSASTSSIAHSGKVSALRITLFYLICTIIWIWGTDWILVPFGVQSLSGFWAAVGKGTVYALVSASCLYLLIKRDVDKIRDISWLLKAVADQTTDAIFIKDREGKYLLFNQAACGFVGRKEEEVLGYDDSNLFDEKSVSNLRQHDLSVMQTGEPSTEEEVATADGITRIYLATKTPLRDIDGNVVGVIGISRDITDFKSAKKLLEISEERNRKLVDLLPCAVFINSAGKISFCNQFFVKLLGFNDSSEIVGKAAIDLLETAAQENVKRRINKMRHEGGSVELAETRFNKKDGGTVLLNVAATALKTGEDFEILAVALDLTEREKSHTLVRAIMGSVPDPIITIDKLGQIQTINPATSKMLEYSDTELIGQNIKTIMPEPYKGEHDGYLSNYLRTGVAKVIGNPREVRAVTKSGKQFPVELVVTEFSIDGQRRFTGLIRDLTDRKQLEDQFRHSQKMEAVGRLAGGVAHDFNNLLTIINGYCALLLKNKPNEEVLQTSLQAMSKAGVRAARLTSQLLAFGRKSVVELRRLDLNAVVTQSEGLLRRLVSQQIKMVLELDAHLSAVKADLGQIEQVIMNLVINARDAMPKGGLITIATKNVNLEAAEQLRDTGLQPGHYVQLCVSDTGTGISDDIKNKIFDPFFTTKKAGEGTGLGLSVVYGVIKQSGGHIAVESALGVGTTFTILLPIDKSKAADERDDSETVSIGGAETILLVEDQIDVQKVARLSLESFGYKVIEAQTEQHALDIVNNSSSGVDLLLTDIVMPTIGGRELANQVKIKNPTIKVLFMSGYVDDPSVREGLSQQTDAFLQKPFSPDRLARKVREVLDRGE